MPCMPEIVSKGTILKKLDALLSDHHKRVATYPDLLATTTAGLPAIPLTDIAQNHGAGLTAGERNHIDTDWFTGWWPAAQALGPGGMGGVEQVVRQAVIEAILKAEELQVPVDCYWECHFQHDHAGEHAKGEYEQCGEESVQASVCWSVEQVTLTFHTPPPMMPMPGGPIEDPVRVIRHVGPGVVTTVQATHMPTPP